LPHHNEKSIQLIRDIRVGVEPLPVEGRVRVSPSNRRSLGLRRERAETKVEISGDGVVVTPPIGAPGCPGGHYQHSSPMSKTPRDHNVV
jgi:hypothetical protein